MKQPEWKTKWDAENTITVSSAIMRKKDTELFELLSSADSKCGLARELMQLALDRRLANAQNTSEN